MSDYNTVRVRKEAEYLRKVGTCHAAADLLDWAASEILLLRAELRKQVIGSNVVFDRDVVNRAHRCDRCRGALPQHMWDQMQNECSCSDDALTR